MEVTDQKKLTGLTILESSDKQPKVFFILLWGLVGHVMPDKKMLISVILEGNKNF